MPSFVATLVNSMSSTTVTFLSAVIDNYWITILAIGFVAFIGYKFLKLAHLTS